MSVELAFLIYAIAFRLAVMAVGGVTIVLGYKLFVRGVYGNSTDIEGRLGEYGLTIKNAAPGTAFCAFGVILVATMVIAGSPSYTREKLVELAASGDAGTEPTSNDSVRTITSVQTTTRMRGDD